MIDTPADHSVHLIIDHNGTRPELGCSYTATDYTGQHADNVPPCRREWLEDEETYKPEPRPDCIVIEWWQASGDDLLEWLVPHPGTLTTTPPAEDDAEYELAVLPVPVHVEYTRSVGYRLIPAATVDDTE